MAWFFSKQTNRNISFAHKFIDSSLQLSKLKNENLSNKKLIAEGFHSIIDKLEQSLKLAISISDEKRIFNVRDALIKYENTYSEDDKLGTWGYAFDLLIEDKNLSKKVQLKKEQEKEIIKELERRLNTFSDNNSDRFNFFAVEKSISRLSSYYKYKNKTRNLRKVLLLYKDSCLHHCKSVPAMVGSELLEKVRIILYQYKLFREMEALEPAIRKYQQSSLEELKKFDETISIPRKEIDNYTSTLLNQNSLFESLVSLSINFIPDKNRSKDIVLKTLQKSPLQFFITQKKIDHTGRVINKIGSTEKDSPERTVNQGHIINQMNYEIQINLNFLELGLQSLKTHKSLTAQNLLKHFFLSPIFPKERYQIIKKGLEHFFNGNYISSTLILILQIESIVRELVKINGGTIYKPHNFQLRSLGSLLKDDKFITAFKLNSNIPRYFELLLTDQRGWNLRNMICHGHFPKNSLNSKTTTAIIHTLLILSNIRIHHDSNQQNKQKQS